MALMSVSELQEIFDKTLPVRGISRHPSANAYS